MKKFHSCLNLFVSKKCITQELLESIIQTWHEWNLKGTCFNLVESSDESILSNESFFDWSVYYWDFLLYCEMLGLGTLTLWFR